MSGRNVVPMPMPHGQPQGQMMPMPQMWSGGSSYPAGCCPPGGDMSALLQCYCDVQAATAFISKVVTDLAANDPAFQQALVDGIAASGSNLPLIGVTNGVDAQPGQVGEWVPFDATMPFPSTGLTAAPLSMGVLQPGDWDCWFYISTSVVVTGYGVTQSPVPAGFSDTASASLWVGGTESGIVMGNVVRALISVPSLIALNADVHTTTAGNLLIRFVARRRR